MQHFGSHSTNKTGEHSLLYVGFRKAPFQNKGKKQPDSNWCHRTPRSNVGSSSVLEWLWFARSVTKKKVNNIYKTISVCA